jgi:hypothetical protein
MTWRPSSSVSKAHFVTARAISVKLGMRIPLGNPGSSQGIIAYRAGTHETKKVFLVFSYFMHVSLFKTCRNA